MLLCPVHDRQVSGWGQGLEHALPLSANTSISFTMRAFLRLPGDHGSAWAGERGNRPETPAALVQSPKTDAGGFSVKADADPWERRDSRGAAIHSRPPPG